MSSFYEENNFEIRQDAIEYLESEILDVVEDPRLKECGERLKAELEQIDRILFARLRTDLKPGRLRKVIGEYVGVSTGGAGYDNLDIFVNLLLGTTELPTRLVTLEPEMVEFHKTPAKVILELTDTHRFTSSDIFYDLGSGLGQVAILVHLLTGIPSRGIEIEPAYCEYARGNAAALQLSEVLFIHADARTADFSEGTVFYMYTPFTGEIMATVLKRLRAESVRRPISIFTYGPCSVEVAQSGWFQGPKDLSGLCLFTGSTSGDNIIYRDFPGHRFSHMDHPGKP